MTLDISFLIPAFDESHNITECIASIQRTMREVHKPVTFEILVGDHDSYDDTARVAEDAGARVYHFRREINVGGVRNLLAMKAKGKVFAFIDADVRLREDWGRVFFGEERLKDNWIIGSYPVGMGESWIQKYWFRQLQRSEYVGSGHMIMTRATFFTLNGFTRGLKTGEDYDLCHRAQEEHKMHIMQVDGLRAYHAREPKTLGQFFWREVWHGTGDWYGVKPKSKLTAFSTAWTLLLLLTLILSHVALPHAYMGLVTLSVALLLHTILVLYKFPHQYSPVGITIQYFLTAMYMLARTISFFYQGNSVRRTSEA